MHETNWTVVCARVLGAALFWAACVARTGWGADFAGELIPGGELASGVLGSPHPELEYRLRIAEAGVYRIETMGYTQVRLQLFGPDQRDKPYRGDAATDRESTPDLVNRHLTMRLQPGDYFAQVRHAQPGGAGEFRVRLVTVETRPAKKEPSLPPIDTSKKSGKLALLVGIDKYDIPAFELQGCVNDALDMQDLLVTHFGFAKEDTLILKDGDATHSNIAAAFNKHLIERAERDAVVVFHFSGHGSQMPDSQGGDETDRLDETIVPADSRTAPDRFDIRDDELNGLFRRLRDKTQNITFVLDSCHSGTGIKGRGAARRISPDDRSPPPAQPWEVSANRSIPEDQARFENEDYVLLAGCRDKELSFELDLNGLHRGAMTYFLTKEIRETNKAGVTYQEIMQRVAANVTRENPSQHPQFEGRVQQQLFSGRVFGTESSKAAAYVLASRQRDDVILQAGRVHGLTPGTTFNVFRTDESELDKPDKRIARIRLSVVDTLTSRADKVLDGNLADIRPMSRAVEHERSYSFEPFPVYLLEPKDATDYFGEGQQAPNPPVRLIAPSESAVLRDVAGWLHESPHFERTSAPGQSRLLIGDDGQRLRVLRNSGEEVFYQGAKYAGDWAIARIKDWGKWYNILAIENRRSQSLGVEVDIGPPGKELFAAAVANAVRSFRHGEQVQIGVRNAGSTELFFVLLDISSDGTVTVVYPPDKRGKALAPQASDAMKLTSVQLPESFTRMADCLKVIATDKPADFGFLEIEGTKAKGSENPLTRLFEEAAGRTASKGQPSIGFEDWATAEVQFEVTR